MEQLEMDIQILKEKREEQIEKMELLSQEVTYFISMLVLVCLHLNFSNSLKLQNPKC